jgi:hypothetical protein
MSAIAVKNIQILSSNNLVKNNSPTTNKKMNLKQPKTLFPKQRLYKHLPT